jgi:thiosulfate dehydrogenase
MKTLIAALAVLPSLVWAGDALPTHDVPASSDGSLVVGLCDGKTSVEVKGHRAGEALTAPQAQAVSNQLMAQWLEKNPGARWDVAAAAPARAADTAGSGVRAEAVKPNVQSGQTYGAYGDRDAQVWAASTQAFVDQGKKVFHDAKQLGGTVGISCDMCHPDAANTHPETYPKYQVQLGRVALLRDMINWCIENPVKGKPLPDDDPKLKAMEAYILAQRNGVPLEYGKH